MDALSPCRAISISTFLVEASLNCKRCVVPKNIAISSSVPTTTVNNVKTVNLCPTGTTSTTLTTNNIKPDTENYENYIIRWYRGNRTTSAGTIADPGVTARPLTVNHSNTTNVPVREMYYVQVIDKDLPASTSCHKWDSIAIISNPAPTVNHVDNITNLCPDNERAINFTSPVADATFTWSNSNTAIGLAAGGTGNISFTAANTGATAITATITVTPSANGCTGTPRTFTITVNPSGTVSPASSTPTVCINTALTPSITHTTTGVTGIGTATNLPAGVTASWSGNTITISGTPTSAGTFAYTNRQLRKR
jgi:hypothetical protein